MITKQINNYGRAHTSLRQLLRTAYIKPEIKDCKLVTRTGWYTQQHFLIGRLNFAVVFVSINLLLRTSVLLRHLNLSQELNARLT